MDGASVKAWYNIDGSQDPALKVVAARHMDADGQADLIWQNDNGATSIWEDFTPASGLAASFATKLDIAPPVNPSGHLDWHVL